VLKTGYIGTDGSNDMPFVSAADAAQVIDGLWDSDPEWTIGSGMIIEICSIFVAFRDHGMQDRVT
jgi:hypothetical protein